ncbi:hypothetical protein GCM10010492_16030 [Saccharothrix mutabilis subsp. mutabilis]|uniref:Uncharacterized protein n=1 Tax=Saccharothrix mutabilis subsp. mutabilis TaxID=66855 RepID=A0ABN0TDF8_9PSEU
MNTTLPPARDLPPGRQAEIRARVERAVTARRPFRFAPLVTAVTAVGAVVAVVAFLQPWQRNDAVDPAQSAATAPVTTTSPTPTTPVIAGLTSQRIAEIEEGCVKISTGSGKGTLYQYGEDEAGKWALVYTESAALICTIDGPSMPYNAGFSTVRDLAWMTDPVAIDANGGSAGGDVLGNKEIYRGLHGTASAAGRVTPEVGRVTFTYDGQTVDATIANGTFVARNIFPADWSIPAEDGFEVRAYDKAGKLLASSVDLGKKCFATPDGRVVHGAWNMADQDVTKCSKAVRWK